MELRDREAKIIILSGKARAGKDTSGLYFKEYYESKGLKVKLLAYASYIKMYAKEITDWDGKDETKPRSLLQELGTEIIRNRIDKLFFVNRIIEDIKVYSYFFDVIVITDARVEEEIVNLKKCFNSVISINVERPGYVNELNENEQKHLTEVGLDNFDGYDYTLVNDGTLEDLKDKVKMIGDEIK